jgi:hypothetical protein
MSTEIFSFFAAPFPAPSEAEKTHPQWTIPKNNPRQICETQKKRCSNSISNWHQALIEFLQTQNESTKVVNSAFVATRKGP